MRGYGVLHYVLRNCISWFVTIISLYNPIIFFAILYPTSSTILVVEVGTRHSNQILFLNIIDAAVEVWECVRYLTIY